MPMIGLIGGIKQEYLYLGIVCLLAEKASGNHLAVVQNEQVVLFQDVFLYPQKIYV